MRNWNLKTLEEKKKAGTIQDYKIPQRKKKPGQCNSRKNKQPVKMQKQTSKALDYIKWNMWYWCNQKALQLEEEFKFDTNRHYRFDFAIPSLKLAVEFEGGVFHNNSGHKTAKHYTKDTDKYNLAQRLGWRVIRFTAVNYTNIIDELNKMVA